jgi:hypothetical protein
VHAAVLFQTYCGVFQDVISFCAVRCDKLGALLVENGYSMVIEVYHSVIKKYINFKFFNPTALLPIEIAWFCKIPVCSSLCKSHQQTIDIK